MSLVIPSVTGQLGENSSFTMRYQRTRNTALVNWQSSGNTSTATTNRVCIDRNHSVGGRGPQSFNVSDSDIALQLSQDGHWQSTKRLRMHGTTGLSTKFAQSCPATAKYGASGCRADSAAAQSIDVHPRTQTGYTNIWWAVQSPECSSVINSEE